MASPLKALADYVYAHRLDWASAGPIIESLRVDESSRCRGVLPQALELESGSKE
jgi:hypothetical protein